MLAVVLVGGFGTRLRPLTNDVPKPMLPVVHRPMISRLVDRLEAGGVTDVVLALGFRPEPFAAAFPYNRQGAVRIHYAVEPEPLDTGGAIAFAARSIGVDGSFVVANGDVITDLDVASLVRRHRDLGLDATIHLTAVADPSAYGVVEHDDGVVRRFVEKPGPGESDSNLINAGTYVLESSVLELVAPGARASIERDVFPQLAAGGRLAAYATDDYWLDVGRPEPYLRANLDLVRGVRGAALAGVHPSALVAADAVVVESVVEGGARIAPGAEVTDSLVLGSARIERNACVRGSIVAGTIGEAAEVTDSVVGAAYDVRPNERLVGARVPD